MGNHRRVAGLAGHGDRIQGLRQGADLVELDQDRVGHTLVDALLQDLGIGHEEVVTHQLHPLADLVREQLPAGPVGFVQTVLDGDDRVVPGQLVQVVGEFGAAEALPLARQVVDAIAVELGGRTVQGQGDVPAQLVAGLAHCLGNHLQGRLVGGQVGCKATLVTHRGVQAPGGKHFFQVMEDFRSGA